VKGDVQLTKDATGDACQDQCQLTELIARRVLQRGSVSAQRFEHGGLGAYEEDLPAPRA